MQLHGTPLLVGDPPEWALAAVEQGQYGRTRGATRAGRGAAAAVAAGVPPPAETAVLQGLAKQYVDELAEALYAELRADHGGPPPAAERSSAEVLRRFADTPLLLLALDYLEQLGRGVPAAQMTGRPGYACARVLEPCAGMAGYDAKLVMPAATTRWLAARLHAVHGLAPEALHPSSRYDVAVMAAPASLQLVAAYAPAGVDAATIARTEWRHALDGAQQLQPWGAGALTVPAMMAVQLKHHTMTTAGHGGAGVMLSPYWAIHVKDMETIKEHDVMVFTKSLPPPRGARSRRLGTPRLSGRRPMCWAWWWAGAPSPRHSVRRGRRRQQRRAGSTRQRRTGRPVAARRVLNTV
jgi:hypothetical protein